MIQAGMSIGLVLACLGCEGPPTQNWQPPANAGAAVATANEAAPTPIVRTVDQLPLDAMVGQVSGHAIYANAVLAPLHQTLTRLSTTERPREFEARTRDLVIGSLQDIVTNKLLVGDAERDLNEQEKAGLRHMVQAFREEQLRQLGGGSLLVAEAEAKSRYGMTLDEYIEDYRTRLLIKRLMLVKLDPKIHVRRRDIEKYYHDHPELYNAPPKRTLRLLIAVTDKADEIDRLLAEGTPFIELARSEQYNARQPENGGLFMQSEATTTFVRDPEVNELILSLKEGEHTPRVTISGDPAWVLVEKLEPGVSKSLREVQLEIEKTLAGRQRQILTLQYREEVMSRGSYTPIDEMADRVLAIALARYSATAPVAGQ